MSDSPTALVHQSKPDKGSTERLTTFDAPAPGTYWRMRKGYKGGRDNRIEANPIPKGTVLMLASIEYADGQPHVYCFAPHPGLPSRESCESRFHADDLYIYFEPAPDGEAVRSKELFALLQEMEQTKGLMMQSPPDAVPAALLEHDPSAVVGQPGQALATVNQLQAMQRRAENLKEDAEKRSSWIQKHSKALGQQGEILANFHQERAEAALAKAKSQLDGVAGILRTVENLRLYTGEGVDVMLLRDGEPAAASERISIYQEVLSLDEEALILLDQGGLDHTRTEELVEALADPQLLRRLIPAQRGMVLASFRSTMKEFVKASDPKQEAAIRRYNAEMSDESKRKRLLVRDGERLWLIDVDAVLAGIKQLMPSAGEQDAYFRRDRWNRREEPTRITREDLDYAKAQRKQLGALDCYGQVLIVLWGLHDRTEMFESCSFAKFSNWLDPGFQNQYLDLVSEDTMLGMERPGFASWQSEHNGFLASGSTVAVNLGIAFSVDNAPGAFSNGRYYNGTTHYELVYRPCGKSGRLGVVIDRVQSDKDGLFIPLETEYAGYNHDVSRRLRTVKLYLKRHTAGPKALIDGVLCLDRIRSSELSYYLESRSQRRGYASYVELFREARLWTANRDAHEFPVREQLRGAVQAARIPHDPDRLELLITDAMAVARTARRDRQAPAREDAGFKPYLKGALATLYALLTDNSARVDAINAWAATQGRQPLRLVLTGKDQWRLYLQPTADEHDDRLGSPTHVTQAFVTFGERGKIAVDIQGRCQLRNLAGEQVIHDWAFEVPIKPDPHRIKMPDWMDVPNAPTTRKAGITDWLDKEPRFVTSYSNALSTLDMAVSQSKAFQEGLDLKELVRQCVRHMRDTHKRYVRRMPLGVTIGTCMRRGHPMMVIAQTDALKYAFHTGDDAIKEACREAVRSTYSRKETQLAALAKDGIEWQPTRANIDLVAGHRKELYLTEDLGRYFSESSCERNGESAKTREGKDLRITSLTPAGAEIFPWMVECTERAIG